jgi:hypothetical protein
VSVTDSWCDPWSESFIEGDVSLCDLTKAFDRVNHDTLLSTLNFGEITGLVNNLIKSYVFPTQLIDQKLLMENINRCYLKMILINIDQF